MRFLLEFAQFKEKKFAFDSELISEIKDVLHDFLEDEIEDVIPQIKEGKVFSNIELSRLYVLESETPNCIFVEKQKSVMDISLTLAFTRLSKMISSIDTNLVCIAANNASIVITDKKTLDIIKGYQKLPDALENAIYNVTEGNKWWKTDIGFEGVGTNSCKIYIDNIIIEFYHPQADFENDIIWDLYFSQKYVMPEHKEQYDEIIRKLEKSTSEVFSYNINDSSDSIQRDLEDFLKSEVLIHFESQWTKKFDKFEETLKNLYQSGIEIDEDIFENKIFLDSPFEFVVKYKGVETILNLKYETATDTIKIYDEFDKLLDTTDLDSLGDTLFLILSEKR